MFVPGYLWYPHIKACSTSDDGKCWYLTNTLCSCLHTVGSAYGEQISLGLSILVYKMRRLGCIIISFYQTLSLSDSFLQATEVVLKDQQSIVCLIHLLIHSFLSV